MFCRRSGFATPGRGAAATKAASSEELAANTLPGGQTVQQGIDALATVIGEKLVLYGIEDPALDAPGFFSVQELQDMYDALLAKGWISYADALEVGVAIEEEDIVDLEAALAGTTSRPLTKTYQQLLNGSENHLRSFEKLLSRLK